MKKLLGIIVLTTLICLMSSCRDRSYMESLNGLEVLHLKGDPYKRGLAHGELLREEIGLSISSWKKEVEEEFDASFEELLGRFYEISSFTESIQNYDPDLLDEVDGIAEGSGINVKTLLAFQMSEEFSTLLNGETHKCTSLGYYGSDTTITLLAQNMDPPLFLHGHPFVMHVIPGDGKPEQFIFTVPGLLGLAGMNSCGVALTCNGMSMLNHKADGLPVISVVRQVLACKSLDAASRFLKQISFGIPQCFSIGGPHGLRCFECSAGEVAEFYPFKDSNLVLHTNHSINNRDFNAGYVELLAHYGKTVDDPYFCPRYFLAYDEIEERNRKLDVKDLQDILRLKEPELEPILNPYTLGTLVMKLDDDPTLSLALGHESDARFHQLDFRKK